MILHEIQTVQCRICNGAAHYDTFMCEFVCEKDGMHELMDQLAEERAVRNAAALKWNRENA